MLLRVSKVIYKWLCPKEIGTYTCPYPLGYPGVFDFFQSRVACVKSEKTDALANANRLLNAWMMTAG